jgi:hypothetical protein
VLAVIYFCVDFVFAGIARPISKWIGRQFEMRQLRAWIRSLPPNREPTTEDHLRRDARHGRARHPDLLIYCSDYHCSHSIAISGDAWPDDLRLSDIEPRFVCQACGKRGTDVRPDFNWDKTPTMMRLPVRAFERGRQLRQP